MRMVHETLQCSSIALIYQWSWLLFCKGRLKIWMPNYAIPHYTFFVDIFLCLRLQTPCVSLSTRQSSMRCLNNQAISRRLGLDTPHVWIVLMLFVSSRILYEDFVLTLAGKIGVLWVSRACILVCGSVVSKRLNRCSFFFLGRLVMLPRVFVAI